MLISRGTAPKQPVEWAHSSNVAKRIFKILKNFYNKNLEFLRILRLCGQACQAYQIHYFFTDLRVNSWDR